MSSYFANSLFTKIKGSDSLSSSYYDSATYTQEFAGRPAVYGHSASLQQPAQLSEFYHNKTFPHIAYHQRQHHGENIGNILGRDSLRPAFFNTPDVDLPHLSEYGYKTSCINEDFEATEGCTTQLFPWMRPQGNDKKKKTMF